jgi:hypothetical protein
MRPGPPDDSEAESKDRSRRGQREPAPATPCCEALLDHHVEELLTQFDELARRYG